MASIRLLVSSRSWSRTEAVWARLLERREHCWNQDVALPHSAAHPSGIMQGTRHAAHLGEDPAGLSFSKDHSLICSWHHHGKGGAPDDSQHCRGRSTRS